MTSTRYQEAVLNGMLDEYHAWERGWRAARGRGSVAYGVEDDVVTIVVNPSSKYPFTDHMQVNGYGHWQMTREYVPYGVDRWGF